MSNPRRTVTRRSALKFGTAVAALPLVHIRTAGAAGKLSLGSADIEKSSYPSESVLIDRRGIAADECRAADCVVAPG